jgi:hypothetical protein
MGMLHVFGLHHFLHLRSDDWRRRCIFFLFHLLAPKIDIGCIGQYWAEYWLTNTLTLLIVKDLEILPVNYCQSRGFSIFKKKKISGLS